MIFLYGLCYVILGIIYPVSSGTMFVPVNFKYKAVEKCLEIPGGIRVDMSGHKIDRHNFGFNVEVESPYDFDENLGLLLVVCTHLDGGYKETLRWNAQDACKSLETLLGDAFRDLQQKANIDGCPFPKGTYKVDNWIFDNEKFETPHMYGSHIAELILTYKGDNQSCVRLHYDLEPKNKWN